MRRVRRHAGWSLGLMMALSLVGCQASPPTTPDTGGTTPTSSTPAPASTSTPSPQPTPTPSTQVQAPAAYRVYTVAGNGVKGDSDVNVAATSTTLYSPAGVAQGPDGSLYIADYKAHRIRKVDGAGMITNIAGKTAFPGEDGDEGPAVDASLSKPYCLVFDKQGNLYFSEYGPGLGFSYPGKVRWIDSNGILHRLSGGGSLDVVDGVPAKDANIQSPEGLAFDKNGRLYVAEYEGHRVLRLESDNTFTIVAGDGTAGNDGDGGPAKSAHLTNPNWLTFDKDGNLYIVDSGAHVIRKVTPGGTISTFAGTGVPTNDPLVAGYQAGSATHPLGDGGQATAATFHTPSTACFDAQGDMLITDGENYLVRRINPQGIITSIAGTGQAPDSSTTADGSEGRMVPLGMPDGLFINSQGQVYLSEYSAYRVRLLSE
ncbi:MAG TPA: hypothetical protein V6D05_10505 [Stenomitos sp.]